MKLAAHSTRIVGGRSSPDNGQRARFGLTPLSDTHSTIDRLLATAIETIGSSSDADSAARRATESLIGLPAAVAATMFGWDAATERLIAWVSTHRDRQVADDRQYRLGEDLVGRAAVASKVTLVGTLATVDPLDGDARRPIAVGFPTIAARVASRDGRLLGVLVLSTGSDDALTPATESLITGIARVLALALEHDRARTQSDGHEAIADVIPILSLVAQASVTIEDALTSIAFLGLRSTRTTAAAVYIADRLGSEMRLAASAPAGSGVPKTWRASVDADASTDATKARSIEASASLGSERVGTLVLFAENGRRFTALDTAMCARLADAVAVAVRHRRLIDLAHERTRPEELLWELLGVRPADPAAILGRAQRLGCDPLDPHVVIVAARVGAGRCDRARAAILAVDRAALVDASSDQIVAVISADAARNLALTEWSSGVSATCRRIADYPAAYRQASEALELGARLRGGGQMIRFEELGSYRFIPALVRSGLMSDGEYELVSRLTDDLLQTLEAYLDSGGNTAQAAKQLFLHRNTLRQRLDRIAAVMDIDLSASERWLALQLAIKAARVARLAAPARAAGSHRSA